MLVEVNCETDFVARGDQFRELVSDIAMQIAACDVSTVAAEDAPAEEVERERAIEMQKEDIQSKPEAIRCAEPLQQSRFPICSWCLAKGFVVLSRGGKEQIRECCYKEGMQGEAAFSMAASYSLPVDCKPDKPFV